LLLLIIDCFVVEEPGGQNFSNLFTVLRLIMTLKNILPLIPVIIKIKLLLLLIDCFVVEEPGGQNFSNLLTVLRLIMTLIIFYL